MTPSTWLEKADSYLAAAQLLLENEHYESAVLRAYYAARYAAISSWHGRCRGKKDGSTR